METCTDEHKDSELISSPEQQLKDDLNTLDSAIVVSEQKVALCTLVVEDLLAIQGIIEDKSLHDVLITQQKNQADLSL